MNTKQPTYILLETSAATCSWVINLWLMTDGRLVKSLLISLVKDLPPSVPGHYVSLYPPPKEYYHVVVGGRVETR